MTENKECQWVTKAIRNLGNMLILKLLALNKLSGKLKVNSFKIPKLRIAKPLYASLKRETSSLKIYCSFSRLYFE